jgi:hypothetical protein
MLRLVEREKRKKEKHKTHGDGRRSNNPLPKEEKGTNMIVVPATPS